MLNYSTREIFNGNENIVILKKNSLKEENVLPHTHDFIEFVYVHSGEQTQCVDNEHHSVERGHLVTIKPGQTHASIGTGGAVYIEILIKPEILDKALNFISHSADTFESFPSFTRFHGDKIHPFETIVHSMFAEYKNKMHDYQSVLFNFFCIFLTLIKRQNAPAITNTNRIPKEVIDYIHSHFREDLSLDMLAQKSCLSPKYFSRIFKNTFDMTLTEYITKKRISEGQYLLLNTTLSISEISESLGWKNNNYFYNNFKKLCNTTPHNYRKNNK